jgi:hypothetical protein
VVEKDPQVVHLEDKIQKLELLYEQNERKYDRDFYRGEARMKELHQLTQKTHQDLSKLQFEQDQILSESKVLEA